MAGWLPDNFGERDAEARAGEAVAYVKSRVYRERRIRTALLGVAVLALAAGLWSYHLSVQTPRGSSPAQVASVAPRTIQRPEAPAPLQVPDPLQVTSPLQVPDPLQVTIQKAQNGVELAWSGSPKKEYVVYRCTSPKFDVCSAVEVVKGNRWSGDETGRERLVFYKVEPRNAS